MEPARAAQEVLLLIPLAVSFWRPAALWVGRFSPQQWCWCRLLTLILQFRTISQMTPHTHLCPLHCFHCADFHSFWRFPLVSGTKTRFVAVVFCMNFICFHPQAENLLKISASSQVSNVTANQKLCVWARGGSDSSSRTFPNLSSGHLPDGLEDDDDDSRGRSAILKHSSRAVSVV